MPHLWGRSFRRKLCLRLVLALRRQMVYGGRACALLGLSPMCSYFLVITGGLPSFELRAHRTYLTVSF